VFEPCFKNKSSYHDLMMLIDPPIADLLQLGRPLLSVEFFPPKDEAGGAQILAAAAAIQEAVRPDFVSITYGAGGTTRERTLRYAQILKQTYGFAVMPHLTCVGASASELLEIIDGYAALGFRNLMALRGDPPKGETTFHAHPDGLRHASELVALVSRHHPQFSIGVAGYPEVHPEAPNSAADLQFLRHKVGQGAAFITTQLFYDNAGFFQFVADCQAIGIQVPIIPGIMPVRSLEQARRFAKVIPPQLEQRLLAVAGDAQATEQVGMEWAHHQIRELVASGVHGVHLYIMNRSAPTLELVHRLRGDGLFAQA
jgi:methylenetetrahydrofolate reductase (NADPH)